MGTLKAGRKTAAAAAVMIIIIIIIKLSTIECAGDDASDSEDEVEDGLYDPFQPDSPPAPSSFGFTPLGSTPLSSGSTLVENIPHSQPISSQLTMLPDSEVEDGLYDTFQPDSPPAPSSSGSTPLSGSMLVENTPHSLSQPIPSQLTMQPDTEGEPSTSLASSQPPLSNTDTTSYVCRVLAQLKALSSGKADTISYACRPQEIVPVRKKKRRRKPSPQRNKRLSSDEQLDKFLARGCQCENSCYTLFDREYYSLRRGEASERTKLELDFVILGEIMAFVDFNASAVVGPSHKHVPTPRQRTRATTFLHAGKKICRETFLALHGIGKI